MKINVAIIVWSSWSNNVLEDIKTTSLDENSIKI